MADAFCNYLGKAGMGPQEGNMTVIMGVNGFPGVGHDAAAALVVDGQVVAAVEEERLLRAKRAFGHPPLKAIDEVLRIAGLHVTDVEIVTYPWLPSAMGVAQTDVEAVLRGWFAAGHASSHSSPEIRFVEHHLAHAWSGLAFVPGGIRSQRVGVLVLDGSGESTGGACYIYDGEPILKWRLAQSSSLGIYFEAVSYYLGFPWGEEGKTMGLASYGRDLSLPVPALPDDRTDAPLPVRGAQEVSPRHVHESYRMHFIDAFRSLHGDHLSFNRRADIALAAQRVVGRRIERYVTELLDGIDVLVLTGGIALNCTINAEVAALCGSKGVRLVIPPPASDTGVALGSALAGCPDPGSVTPLPDPFLGRSFEPASLVRELQDPGASVSKISTEELASALLDGSMICGWFEGRAEIGPRALGKRSIIARPDSAKVRDRINLVKGRESWRPLAPSVTPAEFDRSFAGSTPSPHMLIAATVSPGAAGRLQGVIHVDDTSRPQVVKEPGPYRDLLTMIGALSGTEAVICTSFNQAGEPMVYTPADAIQSARAMGLDLLAGDGWCIRLT